MTELPNTELQNIIIKPDKDYKFPLILVIVAMLMFASLAFYFYYQTIVLEKEIASLGRVIAKDEVTIHELESEIDEHILMHDELVGEVNGYFRDVEFDCDETISICLDELAEAQYDSMASESAAVAAPEGDQ